MTIPNQMTDPTATFPTLAELEAEVRKLAAERPDFIYCEQPGVVGECSYVAANTDHEEGEGCLLGQAMTRLGVNPEWLKYHERYGATPIGNLLRNQAREVEATPCTYPERAWLVWTQAGQDEGKTWGCAVGSADDMMAAQGR